MMALGLDPRKGMISTIISYSASKRDLPPSDSILLHLLLARPHYLKTHFYLLCFLRTRTRQTPRTSISLLVDTFPCIRALTAFPHLTFLCLNLRPHRLMSYPLYPMPLSVALRCITVHTHPPHRSTVRTSTGALERTTIHLCLPSIQAARTWIWAIVLAEVCLFLRYRDTRWVRIWIITWTMRSRRCIPLQLIRARMFLFVLRVLLLIDNLIAHDSRRNGLLFYLHRHKYWACTCYIELDDSYIYILILLLFMTISAASASLLDAINALLIYNTFLHTLCDTLSGSRFLRFRSLCLESFSRLSIL